MIDAVEENSKLLHDSSIYIHFSDALSFIGDFNASKNLFYCLSSYLLNFKVSQIEKVCIRSRFVLTKIMMTE